MQKRKWESRVTNFLRGVFAYIGHHKRKALASLAIVSVLTGTAFAAHQIIEQNFVDVYHVYVGGKKLGTVSSPQVVEQWFAIKQRTEELKYGYSLELSKDITYKHERLYKGSFDNAQTLAALQNAIEVKAKAYKMVVDGEVIGYVKDRATAEQILAEIKNHYLEALGVADKKKSVRIAALSNAPKSANDNGSVEVQEVSVKEDVKLEPAVIDPEEMSTAEEMKKLLMKGTAEEQVYRVQEGDCLGCIAAKFGLKVADLKRMNPGINENTLLQIGQELVVTAPKPKITVQALVKQKEVVDIPYKTEYVEDSSLYRGEVREQRDGSPGKKEITYSITMENGVEISREVIGTTVIQEPVSRILRRGTKPLPNRSTGAFRWPVSGGFITSKYGWRWGKMHTGMDIAGTRGGSIMAADNGKVVFAGWKGNYGKLIIIDHGNGYETYYAHLSSINVKPGQYVAKGQKIGVMGSTGRSTGKHLHFEIRKNGNPVNPMKFF